MMKSTRIGWFLFVGVALLAGLLWFAPVQAAPVPQYTTIPTPTPGPDGRIIYIVQADDTLWRISAITGVGIDELRRLNGLGEDDIIVPGDQLLLGMGGPASIPPTEGPPPTLPPDLPTPTPSVGTGVICVSVFIDADGDALRADEENDLLGSVVNISNRAGTISLLQGATDGLLPRCYEDVVLGIYDIPGTPAECLSIVQCALDLEQGEYNISVGIPEGYNATTTLNHRITLEAGFQEFLDFGAQPSAETVDEIAVIPASSEEKSPILAVVGGALLLVGLGLGAIAIFWRK